MSDFYWADMWSSQENSRAHRLWGWRLGMIAKPDGYEASITGIGNPHARTAQRALNRFKKNVVKAPSM